VDPKASQARRARVSESVDAAPMTVDPLVRHGFPLDRFQIEAIAALDAGRSVLVAAPTGSGKTVVAEHAIADALRHGQRAFYTTPIKALSNQKYRDLAARYGPSVVGLLTGDNSINGDAPVVVMTTEVLRNMIYDRSAGLGQLRYVVLDEVHYLEDTYRGPVWEEVIIHLPPRVRLVCLSATVSNASELADWVGTVRGPTDVVIEEQRPVELRNLYMVEDRTSDRLHLVPTLVDARPNAEAYRFDHPSVAPRQARARVRRPFATPHRLELVERLRDDDLLPAIVFVFSRKGCNEAVQTCVNGGVRLTNREEREQIRTIVDQRTGGLSPSDLEVLGFDRWMAGLEAGIASHHAGMVPPFKETVEELFGHGLVKLVFATETLALGINMPARTVVIEKLTKFTGDHHEFLTAGQYTQLTGRAGRRGIDHIGHAVVLWSPFVTFQQVADLASSRTFFLRSAFRPTYNMTANLVKRYTEPQAHALLNRSFAQFQTDKELVRLEQRLARRGDDIERLRAEVGDRAALEQSRASLVGSPVVAPGAGGIDVAEALSRLRPGDVVELPETGRAAVISVAYRKAGAIRVRLVDADADPVLITPDIETAPSVVGHVELPVPFLPQSVVFRNAVATKLRRLRADRSAADPSPGRPRPSARTGGGTGRDSTRGGRRSLVPNRDAHGHRVEPDVRRRLRSLEQLERAERELLDLRNRAGGRTDSLGRRFDAVLDVLRRRGYVDQWSLSAAGERLAQLYHESDLLVAEALGRGVFDNLDAASLAGLVSCVTYEHRSAEPPPPPWFPSQQVRERVDELDAIVIDLNRDEAMLRIPPTRRPEPSFFPLAYAWASGEPLDRVLEEEDLSGGDFVRHVKLLVDLLHQVARAAPLASTRRVAEQAAHALVRGVVAVSGAVEASPDDNADYAEYALAEHTEQTAGTDGDPQG
jgi:ATP-dependent RNA helicase HelY